MQENKKNICKICDKEYKSYCPTCPSNKDKPRWLMTFCCENCKNIFETLRDYKANKISKEIAKQKLLKLDLSEKDTFRLKIKEQIEEVLKEEISKTTTATAIIKEKKEISDIEPKMKYSKRIRGNNDVSKKKNNSEVD